MQHQATKNAVLRPHLRHRRCASRPREDHSYQAITGATGCHSTQRVPRHHNLHDYLHAKSLTAHRHTQRPGLRLRLVLTCTLRVEIFPVHVIHLVVVSSQRLNSYLRAVYATEDIREASPFKELRLAAIGVCLRWERYPGSG